MFKSNKKTFALIGVYTAILLAIIGMFMFFQKTSNENATNYIYMATKEIKAGDTVDDNLIANYTIKVEYPIAAIKEMEKNGAELVTSPQQISSLVAVSNIPQGQPLTKSLFEAITPSIYGDYLKTYNLNSDNEWKFVNPDYIVLDVNESNTPINGFNQGDEISIEGITDYRYILSYEDDGTENSVEGTYDGILTNHAVVHNMIYNDTGVLTKIGIIIEQEKAALITSVAKTGSILFHSGYVEKWETTTANEYNKLIGNGGIHLKELVNSPVTLTYTNNNNGTTELKLADFSTSIEENAYIYPKFINAKYDLFDNVESNIKIISPYPMVKITHYKLNDASYGEYMDATGLNTNISYNSKTGLFSFTLNESYAEGYYELIFGCLDDKQKQYIECQKVCFVIEQSNKYNTGDTSLNLKEEFILNMFFLNKNTYSFLSNNLTDEEKAVIDTKMNEIEELQNNSNFESMLENCDEIKLEKETDSVTNETFYIEYSENNINSIKITNTLIKNEKVIKEFEYIINEETYKGKLFITETENKTKNEYVIYKVSSYEISSENPMSLGAKLKFETLLTETFANYRLIITEKPISNEDFYIIKETYNYQEGLISMLYNYNIKGSKYKDYFKTLLEKRGIDLYYTSENVTKEKIESINVKKGDISIQVNIPNTNNNDVMTKEQAIIIANILGIDSDVFYKYYGPASSYRISSVDADTMIKIFTNDDIITKLNSVNSGGNSTQEAKDVQDMFKLIGLYYIDSEFDLTNLLVEKDNNNEMKQLFNTNNLIEFIEDLSIEFVLENGETVTTSIKVYC